jgi:hypothetical protein
MSRVCNVESRVAFREHQNPKEENISMKTLKLAIIASALFVAAQARASWYDITFDGGGSDAYGTIDVVSGAAISGSLTITAGGNDGTYSLLPGTGSFSTPPGYVLTYDSLVNPGSQPFVDNAGLLFTRGSTAINLFSEIPAGSGAATYGLYGYPPQWVPGVDYGTATLTAVPEPTTIISGALMLLPFGASTLRILRRRLVA